MADSTSEPEHLCLPPEVWLRIALCLDVESLQALQRSDVVPWDVCDEPTLARTTTLSPHSDASALLRYLQRCDASSVRTLRLTGCLTAVPHEVFQSISLCVQLVELYCVNCVLSPRHLFNVVLTSLSKLTRLEWSLFEQHTYGEIVDIGRFKKRTVPKLRHMYVEVAGGFLSCCLLHRITQCCVSLEHMHVHALHIEQWEVLDACWYLIDPDVTLQSFAYTSQGFPENGDFSLALEARLRVPLPCLSISSAIFGNVTYHVRLDVSCTWVHLKDVIAEEDPEIMEEELIFCVECCHDVPLQLAEQADRPWVRRLRSLTLVLFPSAVCTETGCRHYVSLAWHSPISRFLGASNSLTELNLSLVHFESGKDFYQLFPSEASPLLRAIALPQCGLQTTTSVNRLAISCAMLEELDVRGRGGWNVGGSECPACSRHFLAMNRDTVSALHRGTRLQCLTLCSIYGLKCYRFLAECSFVRLRLSWSERSMTCCDGRSFVAWLGSSEHLRSLTLNCPNVPLNVICNELGYAGMLHLQTLCLVSGIEHSDSAQESISELARRVPLLETVHAHYMDEDDCEHRVTWIRCWPLGFPDVRVDIERGTFLYDAPCSPDCSMTTFIGVKKPRR